MACKNPFLDDLEVFKTMKHCKYHRVHLYTKPYSLAFGTFDFTFDLSDNVVRGHKNCKFKQVIQMMIHHTVLNASIQAKLHDRCTLN